jgi:hypothetical protein
MGRKISEVGVKCWHLFSAGGWFLVAPRLIRPGSSDGRVFHHAIDNGRVKKTPQYSGEAVVGRFNLFSPALANLGDVLESGIERILIFDISDFVYPPKGTFSL